MSECKSIFKHPSNEDEALDMFNSMRLARDNDDVNGVFIVAMQLVTWFQCECKDTRVRV